MFERFTRPARVAVVYAQEEAKELRAPQIDVEHLLLGVALAADGPLAVLLADAGLTGPAIRAELMTGDHQQPLGAEDAEALRSIGIDLDAVRASLADTFGPDALDAPAPDDRPRGWFGKRNFGHIPFTRNAKKVLELSLREALAHKDDSIGAEHILLGVVRSPSDVARALIVEHLSLDELRGRVLPLLDRAA